MAFRPTATFIARSSFAKLTGRDDGSSANATTTALSASESAYEKLMKEWDHEEKLETLYYNEFWWAIAGFLGVLMVLHIAGLASTWLLLRSARRSTAAARSTTDTEGTAAVRARRSSALGRTWTSFMSIVNTVLFRVTLPFRPIHNLANPAELIVVIAYIGATLIWSFQGLPITTDEFWSYRTGLLSACQVPFIVALAGKNNVISWITGLSYERLNGIHRAAGRIVFIESWLHTGGMFYLYSDLMDYVEFRWGLASVIGLSLAVIFSFRSVRNWSYELFLIGHIVFIVVFMAALIMHVPYIMVYTYPGFVFWGFDRIARGARMLGINVFSRPDASALSSRPLVERLSDDTVRVSVVRSRNLMSSWKAGQHFYLIAPGISKLPFESHPFTPATIPHAIDGSSDPNATLDFIIRGRDGFTGRLLNHIVALEKSGDLSRRDTFIVDGPYGDPPQLGVFDTTIMVAGGSGVSYTLGMLLERIRQARLGRDVTSRVLFIWAIRDISHLNWIAPYLRAALNAPANADHPLDIDIRIFVTQSNTAAVSRAEEVVGDLDEKSSADDKEPESPTDEKGSIGGNLRSDSSATLVSVIEAAGGRITFSHGRPDIRQLFDEELAASDGLSVSVDVSGPLALADSVKEALVGSSFASAANALRGGPAVTLHSEVFGW